MATQTEYRRPTSARRGLIAVVVLLVGLVVTFGLAVTDRDTVLDRAQLAESSFGRPLDWLVQDKTSMDPPFPYETEPGLPQEHPTTIEPAPFLLSLGSVLAVELVLLLVLAQVRRRDRFGH